MRESEKLMMHSEELMRKLRNTDNIEYFVCQRTHNGADIKFMELKWLSRLCLTIKTYPKSLNKMLNVFSTIPSPIAPFFKLYFFSVLCVICAVILNTINLCLMTKNKVTPPGVLTTKKKEKEIVSW